MLDAIARRWLGPSDVRDGVVVYSPGHLGDILHTVPMVRQLRQGMPGGKIIWMIGPWSEEMGRRYADLVDEIVVFAPDYPNFWRGHFPWRQGWREQWRIGQKLNRSAAECFITTMPADAICRYLANALCPRIWSGIGDWRPPRVRSDVQTVFQPYERDRYEADAIVGLLGPLGIQWSQVSQLEYQVTVEERQRADKFLRTEGVSDDRPLAIIAPGSGWSGKNWLPERLGEVADWLKHENRCQVAWIGGEAEVNLVPKGRRGDWIWMGSMGLPVLAAVMERASVWVGNDCGPLHLAAAVGIPTLSIWGPTSPGKWGPKGTQHRHVRKMERCPGCIYWDFRAACIRERHECMEQIETQDVLHELEKMNITGRTR